MAHLLHIARPYARAAFWCAKEKSQLKEWKAFLEAANVIVQTPAVLSLLNNPKAPIAKLKQLFTDVLKPTLNTQRENFLSLLALRKRFILLPDILKAFQAYAAQLEKESTVRIVTAVPTKETFNQKLVEALQHKLNRQVQLKHEINPAILGGALIYIGDRVIDGSVRGELARLLEFTQN
ncbi:MAG: ATP synthase F1 subunit delta [Gammaproteobacteria bacterium RIFCSPHIGHO2_12_FULL_42_10]|nr:MAG: ATP synthase F1 subunit delta [Gammaproteobacteria bacterium RIFCSPHIGHO2_12_FULL_42_10]